MAGILGLIDLQQIRQNLGFSQFNIPSPEEVDAIKRKQFGAAPLEQTVMPSEVALKEHRSRALGGGGVTSMFYRKEGYSVGDLAFDLILSEDHAFESNLSTHPVEDKADITDHIQQMLQGGRLKGLVSNHSIHATTLTRSNARTANSLGAGRAGTAWEICRWIWENREPVTIVTSLDTYPNVGIKQMTTHRDSETGDCLEIEVTFQQMRRVSLKVMKAQAVVGPKNMTSAINQQVAPTVDQGKVVGQEVIMDLGEAHLSGVVK